MTVNPSPPRRARRWLGALTALAFVLAPVSGAVSAAAAAGAVPTASTPSPTPTPSPTLTTGVTEFTLSPVGSGIVRPGEALAVSVTAGNGTALALPSGSVSLALGTTALADRGALTQWLAGEGDAPPLGPVGTAVIDPVAPGETQTAGILVAADDPALVGRAPGVYPLLATYQSGEATYTSASVAIVPDAAAVPQGIGVVVPVTAGARSDGLIDEARLVALTSESGSLTAQLDAVEGTAAILAVDPAIPASIRVLGASAPPEATAWLERLEALPNSRFALQFGDADVAAQLQSGLAKPLQPTTLQPYLDPADFPLATEPTPDTSTPAASTPQTSTPDASTPTPTATTAPVPGQPVYPSLEDLLDIGGAARSDVYWPFTGTAGADVVAGLGSSADADQRSLTLVPSSTTSAGADGQTVSATARAGEASVLVYDSAISAALGEASQLDEATLRGAELTEASAHLAFAARETGGAPLLVSLDRGTDRSRIGLRTAIVNATEATGFVPVSLSALAAEVPNALDIADIAADAARVDAVASLRADEQSISDFATILDDSTLLTAPERAGILQVLGGAWLPQPELWATALAAHRAETTETLQSVSIRPRSDYNLIGSSAPLGFWVRNELEWPVNVVLVAIPDDPRLVVQRLTNVTAQPASNTRAEIPVDARVGSGEVTIELQLRSRTSVAIGTTQYADVTVRAEWEGIGIALLATVAGAFLAIGLVRTILRRRRARRATDASVDTETNTSEAAGSHADKTTDTDAGTAGDER